MAEHFKDHPGVIGWQIDNELGWPEVLRSRSHAAFQAWCQRKYHTLDALNAAWGTVFWGHTYQAWQEIPFALEYDLQHFQPQPGP
jgi:beta-galactosidase